jgi:phospholipid transport system substrate-binding protein
MLRLPAAKTRPELQNTVRFQDDHRLTVSVGRERPSDDGKRRRLVKALTLATLVVLVVAISGPGRALGNPADALDALRGPIDRGLALLRDPAYKDAARKQEQREKIWQIVREAFDFTEVAKRALAKNWLDFTPAERKAFTELFAELLGNTYLDKIQGGFNNETVEYSGKEIIDDTKTMVKTKILREQIQIPVDYMMMSKEGSWKVYDVNVEGISLVKNYRTQFAQILEKQKPAQLIERVRSKVEAQKSGAAGNEDLTLNMTDGIELKALQLKACAEFANMAGGLACQGAGVAP